MEKRLNILLVDNHRMVVDGLKSVLETQPDFKVIAAANNVQEAMRCCNDLPELDLIVVDINLSENGPNGLELTRQIKKFFPEINVLICSMHDKIAYIMEAKEAGADGFISKNASGSETVQAIREVGNGNDAWPPVPAGPLPPIPPRPTPKELQVLKYLARSLTTPKIGIELAMPEATVSAHRHHIMQKNNLQTQGELFDYAKECMELYGIPPDPVFAEVLDDYKNKFKEMNINVEFAGETDGFDNRTTQALSRVMDCEWNNIRHRNSPNGGQRVSNIYMELKQDSSRLEFIIRYDGKHSGTPIKSSGKDEYNSLEKILGAIGGELTVTVTDSGTTVIAILRSRRFFYF